jgi:hypothetical protein
VPARCMDGIGRWADQGHQLGEVEMSWRHRNDLLVASGGNGRHLISSSAYFGKVVRGYLLVC